MKKFAALALCAAMTASMMGAVTVSANDSGVESIDDLAGKRSEFSLEPLEILM